MLTLDEKKAIGLIRDDLKPFIEARDSDLIKDADVVNTVFSIRKKLLEVQASLRKKEEIDFDALSMSVVDMVKLRHPHLTLKEFDLTCVNAMLGDYGIIYSINLTSVSSWIKGFYEDKKRHEAFKEWNVAIEKILVRRSDTPLANHQITLENCISFFEDYKNSRTIPFYGYVYHDRLNQEYGREINKKGKMVRTLITDQETRNKIAEESEAEYVAYVNKGKTESNADEINKVFESMLAGNNRTYINVQKKLMVKYFFDSLIREGKSLKELVG
jgi:hypothetical protein